LIGSGRKEIDKTVIALDYYHEKSFVHTFWMNLDLASLADLNIPNLTRLGDTNRRER